MSQLSAFDFLVGNWSVHHRYLVRRLAGCADWIEFGGNSAMRKILNGFGNLDEGEIRLPAGAYVGVSLRTFDPATENWSIYWLDSRHPERIDPPVVGRFESSLGTFVGDDVFESRPIRMRFLWSRIGTGSPRWEQAFSGDGGSTWETNWIMDFTRA